MKTEEEIFDEMFDEFLNKNKGNSLGSPINAAYEGFLAGYNRAYKIAFKEGQSNPKIKQLEWERHATIHYVNQYNPIGYTAAITKWGFGEKQYSVRLALNDSNSSVKIFNSLDEAKDFVQKDFEARIKECLIIE